MTDLPNVLFVTVDSLRADHAHGGKAETPTFDRVAEAGTEFDRTFAQGPYTTFSMPSLFTSRYPSRLTSIDFVDGVEGVLVEGASTIQERFRQAGYTTAGIHTNPLLSELFGFDVGFDYFDDGLGGFSDRLPGKFALLADKIGRLVRRHPYVPADRLTDRAIEWLQSTDDEPFFLWVHYMDVHGPYQSKDDIQYLEKYRSERLWRKAVHSPIEVTESERERLRETYVEEVSFTDREIGRLLDAFEESTGLAESMVAITADHGEEFFEHGSYSHESKLYEELIHVPLAVDPPASHRAIERDRGSLVPLLDVGPTLLQAAGASLDGFEGTSLFESKAADGRDCERPEGEPGDLGATIVSEARLDPVYIGAVRTSDWKYIDDAGDAELYHLGEDPNESSNVLESNPEVATRLEELLDAHRSGYSAETRSTEHLDSDELDGRLRSLGYLE
ncbi:sulfatase [Halopenitus persicus]|uniref:Arylsulfatase n=1 Tax=Halopenitus persicus TaxID=1048396 RepID=A0A1H3IZ87_9EURY|nr:sulfatase [Halopenitus persicus]SDY33021.1 arylsulfatase [Halopenitus persicus]